MSNQNSDKKKLLVIITNNANSDKSTIGFTLANASLSTGLEVAIFLTSDGIELSREGACDLAQVRPFKQLSELIHTFIDNGGTILCCGSCIQYRGMDQSHTVHGMTVAGIGAVVEWIAAGATVASF
jgi:predicted peroxiredoxin